MKNTYKATFQAQALVTFVFEVEAENQQEALVLAHDLVVSAPDAQAKVMSVDRCTMQNSALERIAQGVVIPPVSIAPVTAAPAPVLPSVPEAPAYEVRYFETNSPNGEPAKVLDVASRAQAELWGQLVLAPDSEFGCARVFEKGGGLVSTFYAPRGGWEVEAVQPQGESVQKTWLPSKASAVSAALAVLSAVPDCSKVRIRDFTNRRQGSVVFREMS